MELNQSQWLKSYVEFDTQKRTGAVKNWDTVGNLRNRIDVKFVNNEKIYSKWTSEPSYMSQKVLDNDLLAIQKSKIRLTLNKPACVGMYILDLSKVLMYEFHYDYIKNKYGNISILLFTDTDSLIYEIEDVYKDFSKGKKII